MAWNPVRRTLQRAVTRKYVDTLRMSLGEAALMAQRAARPSFVHLWDAEIRVFSQWGEDGILDFLCDSLELHKPHALEYGAGDFTECNTRFLAERRSASLVVVDANTALTANLQDRDLVWRTSIWPITSWITPQSAVEIFSMAEQLMGHVDLLSVDIDGNDYWVVKGLNLSGIRIVVVEYNPLFGHSLPVSIPEDDDFQRSHLLGNGLYFGASLRAWVDLLGARGFTFVGTNRAGNNAFFCDSSSRNRIPLPEAGTSDLSTYVDWRVRESRDVGGKLSYLSGPDGIKRMAHLPLVNTANGQEMTVADAWR